MFIALSAIAFAGSPTRLVADTPAELTQSLLKSTTSVTVALLDYRATDQSTEFRPGSTVALSVVCATSCTVMNGKNLVVKLDAPVFDAEAHDVTWTTTLDRRAVEIVWTPSTSLFTAFRAR